MKRIFSFLSFLLLSLVLMSCESNIQNSITFENLASNDVHVNFRGQRIDVTAGSTVKISEIDKGEFTYDTVYEIPAEATSTNASENLAGTFVIEAATKILVIYSSTLESGVYYISASITSSDDISESGIINPIGQ
jgi:hypothetical protein